jgi:hypothetical protein
MLPILYPPILDEEISCYWELKKGEHRLPLRGSASVSLFRSDLSVLGQTNLDGVVSLVSAAYMGQSLSVRGVLISADTIKARGNICFLSRIS